MSNGIFLASANLTGFDRQTYFAGGSVILGPKMSPFGETVCGVYGGGKDITEVLDLEEDIVPIADMCMEMGCRILLIKCGAPGMYLRTAGSGEIGRISRRLGLDAREWAGRHQFEVSYVPDRILSGTGAGDTSIAAFLTAMTRGTDPDMCLHLAAAEGASCITEYDALSGLKSLEELTDRIRHGWKKASR